MRSILAGARGLLGGWLANASAALLMAPAAMGAGRALEAHERMRIGLALAELAGATLFAFEPFALTGFVLLLGAFALAAAWHLRSGEIPWILALYALVAAFLLYGTRRCSQAAGAAGAACAHESVGGS